MNNCIQLTKEIKTSVCDPIKGSSDRDVQKMCRRQNQNRKFTKLSILLWRIWNGRLTVMVIFTTVPLYMFQLQKDL